MKEYRATGFDMMEKAQGKIGNVARILAAFSLSCLLYAVNGAQGAPSFIGFTLLSLTCVYFMGFMLELNRLFPADVLALFALVKSRKAQSSLEYIMMVAAASVVIVLALAMVVKLKGAVVSNVSVNGNSMSISQAIANELGSLTSNGV